MEFGDLTRKRQSTRRYSEKIIEKEKVEKCIEAARMAPSACNSQPWWFIVVDDKNLLPLVARETYSTLISFNKFVQTAQLLVVIVIEKPKVITQIGATLKDREYPLIDIGIAAEHFCLQAAELGLGTCMLGWFNEKPIKNLLSIPKSKRIGLMISVGYPADSDPLREKIRKPLHQMCSFNKY